MGFPPGDSRARNAYDEWCIAMDGTAADGTVLGRWEQLTAQEQAAWQRTTAKQWTDATAASARMNSPTAGCWGGASGAAAGVRGYPASAVPSMMP